MLVDFYEFVKDLQGVEDLHFLIRDRVDHDVVFSFRIFLKIEDKDVVKSKIKCRLKRVFAESKFSIDPNKENPLYKYVGWDYKERVNKYGRGKFDVFYAFLGKLSRIVVDMAKKGISALLKELRWHTFFLGCLVVLNIVFSQRYRWKWDTMIA